MTDDSENKFDELAKSMIRLSDVIAAMKKASSDEEMAGLRRDLVSKLDEFFKLCNDVS